MSKKTTKKKEYSFTVLYTEVKEGGYQVNVPALPGLITFGRTIKEAREMAEDAIKGYVASLKKHNEPIPSNERSLITSIQISATEKAVQPANA